MKKIFGILILFGLLLSACTSVGGNTAPEDVLGTGEPGDMMETAVGDIPVTGGEIDDLYINMMVPHHQSAVEMARIAQERSQQPEIQELASNIIASQEDEIAMMQQWKEEWYGTNDIPDMSEMPLLEGMAGMSGMNMMNMEAEVEALRNAPEPFDLAFIDAMVNHHQQAIEASRLALNSAVHPEINQLAQEVIDEQQLEIDRLLSYRQQWFPDAAPLSTVMP